MTSRKASGYFFWLGFFQSNHPEVFLGKGVLKICSKFTGEHLIEIALWHGRSPVNLRHFFRTHFLKNTSRWLLQFLIYESAFVIVINLQKSFTSLVFCHTNLTLSWRRPLSYRNQSIDLCSNWLTAFVMKGLNWDTDRFIKISQVKISFTYGVS